MTETIEKPAAFETEVCSRCGGSGNYSYCEMWGTVCFKCKGQKAVLTKRGAVAAAFFNSLCETTVGKLQAGDVVKVGWGNGWARVTEIESAIAEGASLVGGVMTPYRREVLNVHTNKGSLMNLQAESVIRKGQSVESRAAKMAQAIAFQETLTKAGTVRVRK